MAERKAIPKKIRFEVFKRDKFTCQYCGRSAPDVILQVDHIKPVAKGGKNDIMNLVTSCRECNIGKGANELSDNSAVAKQRAQLERQQESIEQLKMMLEWREEMVDASQKQLDEIIHHFSKSCNGEYILGDRPIKTIKKLQKEFSLVEILDAIDIAFLQYYDGSKKSAEKIIDKLPGICANRKRSPIEQDRRYWFNYLKKVLDSRCYNMHSFDRIGRLRLICDCIRSEDEFERAKRLLIKFRDVDDWLDEAEGMINEER